jgi:hypothetical protein
MNNIESVIKYITEADRIERECAERTSSILRTAIEELQSLQDRIDAGEFNV